MVRVFLCAVLAAVVPATAAEFLFDFPTANHALVEGRPDDFFMYVNRDFEGKRTTPWEGGQYGFVRGPERSGGEIVYSALHEGIDIRPLRRDAAGNPLDPILAAAAGTVVYVNDRPGGSNYGRYLVIEHIIDRSPYYTLYAHLASIAVAVGDSVRQGQTLGVMGYSGVGLDRERSHLHFEFALMLSPNFSSWYASVDPNPNPHGNFNGRNLVGLDPGDLLAEIRAQPGTFRLTEYLRNQEAYFSVAVPASPHLNILRMYPWLFDSGSPTSAPTWVISFTRTGVPVRAKASPQPIPSPRVTWVRSTGAPYARATRGLVTGGAGQPILSKSGQQLIQLLAAPPVAPAN